MLLVCAGTAVAAAGATGAAGRCLSIMSRCDFTGSDVLVNEPRVGDSPPAWATVPESIWFTKQANNALYRCMTTGSARNKGVDTRPTDVLVGDLLDETRFGGALNATGLLLCCASACDVPQPVGQLSPGRRPPCVGDDCEPPDEAPGRKAGSRNSGASRRRSGGRRGRRG
jgi:hypothetical protein